MGNVQSTGWLRLTAAMLYSAAPASTSFSVHLMSEPSELETYPSRLVLPADGVTEVPWRG